MKDVLCIFSIFSFILFPSKKGEDNLTTAPAEPTPTLTAIRSTTPLNNLVVTIAGTNFGTTASAIKVHVKGLQGMIQTISGVQIRDFNNNRIRKIWPIK